ncbi:MAG: YtxH domain-containing protein [Patescibacteria group bacterium]
MSENKSSNFGLGLMLGAIGGALAALFLTPTTGVENRKKAKELYEELKKQIEEGQWEEKAKELYGDVSEEGKRLYAEVSVEVSKKLEELKDQVEEFDKEKFRVFVQDTVNEVGTRVKASVPQMEKLVASIMSRFETETKKTEKAKRVLKPKIKVEG